MPPEKKIQCPPLRQGDKGAVWRICTQYYASAANVAVRIHSGGVVWTNLFIYVSSVPHSLPKEIKACRNGHGLLKCPFCVSERRGVQGTREKRTSAAERSVASACMCAHTKVIIMMMNGTGWRKKMGSAYQVVLTLFSFPGLKFLRGSLG